MHDSKMTQTQIIDQAWADLLDIAILNIGDTHVREVVENLDSYQKKYLVTFTWTGERWDFQEIKTTVISK